MTELVRGPVCHARGISGYGPSDARIMFVGVAPGKSEIESGRPRTGQAGKLMRALLSAVGVDMDATYNTNLMCYANPKPTPEEIALCLPRLRAEIARFRPKLIVPLGNIPTDAIVGASRHKGDRGAVLWMRPCASGDSDGAGLGFSCYVMPTWEPAAVLYLQSASLVSDLVRDFGKLQSIVEDWPDDGSIADVRFEYIRPRDAVGAQRVLDAVPRRGAFVSVDIETSSRDSEVIDAEVDRLLCVGIGWHESGTQQERVYVIPASALAGVEWPRAGVDPIRWTFQYGQFDTYGLERQLGVRIPIVEDSLLLSYSLDERGAGLHKLKTQAREYCGAGWYDEEVDRRNLPAEDELGFEEKVVPYNAKDVAYTLRLTERHYPLVAADAGLLHVYKTLLIPGANVFRDAQAHGIRLDVDKVEELYAKWQPEQDALRDRITELAASEGFQGEINIKSAPQMQKLFYQIMGLPVERKTKKGAPSTDKYMLDALDHPIGALLRDHRTYDVVLNLLLNYMQNLKPDGRLHPMPSLHRTVTGRLAYSDPPVHGTPKAYTVGEELARVAECLCATNDDYEILVADYEQIEVWTCWAYTMDEQLESDLRSGDVHSATAEGAFNTRREMWDPKLWQIKRQNAKKVRFGLMYGEGAEKLSTPPPLGIGGTKAECQTFIENFWRRYPQHRAKLIEWERAALNDGELVSAFGRKRRFPLVLDHRSLRQAINFPIQSTAADYSLASAIELDPQLRALGPKVDAHLLMSWHDALVIEYRRETREQVHELVRRVMESPKIEGFPPIRVEMKVGPNFGQVKKVSA